MEWPSIVLRHPIEDHRGFTSTFHILIEKSLDPEARTFPFKSRQRTVAEWPFNAMVPRSRSSNDYKRACDEAFV